MAKTDVAVKEEDKLPEVAGDFDYGDDSGEGFEDVTGKDLSIPFINLLQGLSPIVMNCEDGSIRAGMMRNGVTGEIYDGKKGLVVIPVHKDEVFVEWVPRKQGGGFVAIHDPTSDEVQKAIEANGGSRIPKKDENNDKIPLKIGSNELVETYYVYCMLLNEEGTESEGFCVFSFTSSKIKRWRDWLTSMYTIKGRPPIYAVRAKLTTETMKNEDGTFANYVIKPFGDRWAQGLIPKGSPLYDEAKGFAEMVKGGMARADLNSQEGGSEAPGEGKKAASLDDEEVPF